MSVITSFHPTFAFFRNPYEYGAFCIDLDRFARMTRGELRAPPSSLNLEPSAEDIRALALANRHLLAYDIETSPESAKEPWTGKDPTRAKLRMIGFGGPNAALAYYWHRNSESCQRAVRKILGDKRIRKTALNEKWFDDRVLARYGIKTANVFGLREARRAISSTSKLSLAHIASLYDDVFPWKEEDEDDDKGLVFTDNIEDLALYNCYDCIETARGSEGVMAEDEWNTPRVQRLYETHRRLAQIAGEMHTRGWYVKETNRKFMAWCLEKERRQFSRKMSKLLGMPEGWTPSPPAMRSLIYKRYAVPGMKNFGMDDPQDPKMWTKEGLIKVNKSSLINVVIDPFTPVELKTAIELYWKAQQAQKWRSTFLDGKKVTHAIGKDGYLRPGWNSCGTDTMRWACSEPNMMNLPQILRAFVGPAPGRAYVHLDKSQLELRMMYAISGDEVLREALETGDVYSADAIEWFGLPVDADVKKDYPKPRKASKIIHLGSQYLAGKKTVHAQALMQDRGMTYSAVAILHDKFLKRYEQTVRYGHAEFEKVEQLGYSEGRILETRRYYPRGATLNEACNFPVQTTAGELMNLEMIALDDDLKATVDDAYIIGQLHDAIDVDCRIEDVDKVIDLMEKNCGGNKEYTIDGRKARFPIEIKVAYNDWSEV